MCATCKRKTWHKTPNRRNGPTEEFKGIIEAVVEHKYQQSEEINHLKEANKEIK
jgi:hypothetical protein